MSVYDLPELRNRFSSLFIQKGLTNFASETELRIAIGGAADLALALIHEAEDECEDSWKEPIEGFGFVVAAGYFMTGVLALLGSAMIAGSIYIWNSILG